jgi:hypothetical protein
VDGNGGMRGNPLNPSRSAVPRRKPLRNDHEAGSQRLIPWEAVRADLEARQQRHAARPAPARAVVQAWWWCQRAWRSTWHPPLWRRLRWNWQRMRRGWSDRDTWSLDWYLAGVISGSVAYMRDHGHTYPGEENGADKQQWRDILTRIAGPLSVNRDRIIDGETPAQRRERQERELAEQQEALQLLAWWSCHLWD